MGAWFEGIWEEVVWVCSSARLRNQIHLILNYQNQNRTTQELAIQIP